LCRFRNFVNDNKCDSKIYHCIFDHLFIIIIHLTINYNNNKTIYTLPEAQNDWLFSHLYASINISITLYIYFTSIFYYDHTFTYYLYLRIMFHLHYFKNKNGNSQGFKYTCIIKCTYRKINAFVVEMMYLLCNLKCHQCVTFVIINIQHNPLGIKSVNKLSKFI